MTLVAVPLPLFLLITIPNVVIAALIQCKKCDYDFETEQEVCWEDCSGTLCFYTEYYYEQPQRVFNRKGCLSGAPPATLGCRSNQNGQLLCICDTDHCNREPHALTKEPPTQLQWQVCKRQIINGIDPPPRWTPPCAGNYCVYRRSKFTYDNGTKGYSSTNECSNSNDFDLFSSRVPFLFYPESCVKMEYGGQQDETMCYGSTADDTAAEYPTEGLVECHADFLSKNLPYIPIRKLCTGQFCVISALPQGDVYRGCLTIDQSKADRQMAPGYYRSYNGIEQWICAAPSCNYNLRKLEESWPEELAEFKNISRLHIEQLFEELNTASTTTLGNLLFVVTLCIVKFVL
nr:Protein C15C8.5 [Haemonchus contortus]